ncbi:hypothetical protein TNIN_791 [Trichonephila inaurata madagascariensis]|uniref:Uncharacterized protein n=1 Tax=Trichonephila inaurata madagascariensis TaxID=2747483 RepID=A0A8X6WVK1_9ARAC|nr:hypothetical protein TNIN_791 [Trichonephila inaurata madagascariensis]
MFTLRSCPELGLIIQKDPISHSRRSMFLEMVWCGHSLLASITIGSTAHDVCICIFLVRVIRYFYQMQCNTRSLCNAHLE